MVRQGDGSRLARVRTVDLTVEPFQTFYLLSWGQRGQEVVKGLLQERCHLLVRFVDVFQCKLYSTVDQNGGWSLWSVSLDVVYRYKSYYRVISDVFTGPGSSHINTATVELAQHKPGAVGDSLQFGLDIPRPTDNLADVSSQAQYLGHGAGEDHNIEHVLQATGRPHPPARVALTDLLYSPSKLKLSPGLSQEILDEAGHPLGNHEVPGVLPVLPHPLHQTGVGGDDDVVVQQVPVDLLVGGVVFGCGRDVLSPQVHGAVVDVLSPGGGHPASRPPGLLPDRHLELGQSGQGQAGGQS